MTKIEVEKEKDLIQEEEKLVQESMHLQALSEEYDMASKSSSVFFEEVSSLFRDSSDWAYYQNLAEQHDEQQRQFRRGLQEQLDNHIHRQRAFNQQQEELKDRLRGKGEN